MEKIPVITNQRQRVNDTLKRVFTSEEIAYWWQQPWECVCSVSHGTREEFFHLNPAAVVEIAGVEVLAHLITPRKIRLKEEDILDAQEIPS